MSSAVESDRQGARNLRWALATLNVLGGMAVIGSYSMLFTRDDANAILWGGVPQDMRSLYTTNMWLAAVGYFPFTALFLFGADPVRVRFFGGRAGYGILFVLYGLVLVGSALWMPMTFAWADSGAFPFWWIRLDLALVGVGSIGLLAALVSIQPRPATWLHVLAFAGCLAFCLQTAVLDGAIWPAYYPRP